MEAEEKILHINIGSISPNPNQPRKSFDEASIKELALSIKEYGILNPILVRKKEDKYEIIAGERRYRAAKLIGLTEIPVIVKQIPDDKIKEIALIENLQREGINPIEEAQTYQEIINSKTLTEQKLSEMIGKSQSYISNKIRLLRLPENIQKAISDKKISEKHARSLMTVDNKERQTELLEKIIKEKLTVKELDNIINEKKITEEEIQSAINDIMKSLNVSDEEEKEEKESDNMNNGNFFPNYNQETQSNETSLNSMNMQTMNQTMATPEATPAPAMPTYNIPTPEVPNIVTPTTDFTTPAPQPEIPQIQGMEQPTGIPNFGEIPQAVPAMPEPAAPAEDSMMINPSIPTPEINAAIPSAPIVEPTPVQNYTPVMEDTPLFNPELQNMDTTPAPQPEMSYEVPVNTQPESAPQPQDRIDQVKELLNSNGIEYKAYSNETGHCIIIEL